MTVSFGRGRRTWLARLRALGRSRSQQSTGLLLCTARPSSPSFDKKENSHLLMTVSFGRGRRTWTLGTRFWSFSKRIIISAICCYLVLYSLLICANRTKTERFWDIVIFLVQKFCTNVRKMLEAVLEERQFLPLLKFCRLHHSEKFNFFFYVFFKKPRALSLNNSIF